MVPKAYRKTARPGAILDALLDHCESSDRSRQPLRCAELVDVDRDAQDYDRRLLP